MHVYVSAITIARVPPVRTDPKRARNHPRGIDPARAVLRTDTNTIHDGGKAIRAIRTPARLDGVSLLNLNLSCMSTNVYIHILQITIL